MRKLFNYISLSCLFCLLNVSVNVYGHSVQVGYCVNCSGNLRIYVEHWHTIPDYTTTMDIELSVNGVTTTITGSPKLFISDTVKADLPECITLLTIFGACPPTQVPCTANTCNYWVAYDFPNIQKGVPITITIISGNNIFTQDGCSMFPAKTNPFVIPLDVSPTAGPSQTICSGNTANVILANYVGTLQWQTSATSGGPWTNIPGATSTPLSTGVLNSTTYYQAIATGDCGSYTSNEVAIKVAQPPAAEAGGGPSGLISSCPSNTPANIGTTSVPGYSYSWSPGTGLSSTTVSDPTASLATPGSTTYTVTTSAPGCASSTDQVVVNVTSLPTASISGTASVCQNATGVNITLTGANGTPPYTFTYKLNGGGNQTVQSIGNVATVTVTTTALGIFSYDLVSVQDASVITCSQVQTGNATVTVNLPPTASISGATTVCVNDPSPLITFTGSGGTAPYTFTYTINGGTSKTISTTGGSSSATIAVPTNIANTFTYDVVSISDASSMSCGSANTSAVVKVSSLPVSTITGTTSVCLNGPQPNITFTGLIGTPPFTFNYTMNAGAPQSISTVSGNTVTLSVPTNVLGTFIYANVNASSATCTKNGGDTAKITVTPLPSASISGTTGVCRNAAAPSILFTGITGTPPFTFTYTINGGPNQTVTTVSGNTVTVQAPTAAIGTYMYALVKVADASCSTNANGSAVITVTSSVNGTITGNADVCQNGVAPTVTFTGANGTAPYTFTYSVNNGASQTVSTIAGNSISVPASINTAGVFVYSLTGVQDVGNSNCYIATGSATVTVNGLPTAGVAGATSVCLNDTPPLVIFTGGAGVAPYTFTYSINGGPNLTVNSGFGNVATVSVPTNVAGSYTYALISVKDASLAGCTQLQNGSVVVTINDLPTATISGSASVCQNDPPPDITFTGSNGIAPYTFVYRVNGGIQKTVTTAAGSNSVTVPVLTTLIGSFSYALVSVKDASLKTCVNFANGTAKVIVNSLPTGSISGPFSVCQDSPEYIVFTGGSGNSPFTFSYTLNNGAPQTLTTAVNSDTVMLPAPTSAPGTFVYSLLSVKEGSNPGCVGTILGNSNFTITVNPIPKATIGPSKDVCIYSSPPNVTFKGSNGTPPYKFTYTVNGKLPKTIFSGSGDSVNIPNPTIPTGKFVYTLISVGDAGTTGCINTTMDSAVITVHENPTSDFYINPQTTTTLDPTVKVTDASRGARFWIWDYGDSDSAFIQNPEPHVYKDSGTYVINLIVRSQYGCRANSSHTVKIEVPFLIYIPSAFSPNGDNKNEIFTVKGEAVAEFEMMIFDRWGNFIFYSDDIDKGWDGTANLGSETSQSDVYVYSIKLTDIKHVVHNYKGTVTIVK